MLAKVSSWLERTSSRTRTVAATSGTLDPAVRPALGELIRLRLDARNLVLSRDRRVVTSQAGGYLSAYKGRGIDFEESRVYQPGDDFRTIDWRVTARTGEAHTKVFREERERPVLFLVDQGASMAFGTRGRFKAVTAAHAAALLAWAAVDSGDRVGGVVRGERRQLELRPAGRRLGALRLLKHIVAVHEGGAPVENGSTLELALRRISQVARPGALVFLISDFREFTDTARTAVDHVARHCDLVAIVIYDTVEAEAPPANLYAVSNGTAFACFDTRDRRVNRGYEQHFERRVLELQQLCARHAARCLSLNGTETVLTGLRAGLGRGRHRV